MAAAAQDGPDLTVPLAASLARPEVYRWSASAGKGRRRAVSAGYDPGRLPIRVAPRLGESPASWLTRAAARYGLAPRQLLGIVSPSRVTSERTLRDLLHEHRHRLADLFALTAGEVAGLVALPAVEQARIGYWRRYRGSTVLPPPGSRFCPDCLDEPDPHWRAGWRSPLTLACVEHGLYLVGACPGCGVRPRVTGSWLERPDAALSRCPQRRYPVPKKGRRAVRDWCAHELTGAARLPASDDVLVAQQLLDRLAAGPHVPIRACGVGTTQRQLLDAVLELVCEQLDDDGPINTLDDEPSVLAAAATAVLPILRAPTLEAVGKAAHDARMLHPGGPLAPIGPAPQLTARPRNPVLAAAQLASLADQLTPPAQLTFRTGTAYSAYPTTHEVPEELADLVEDVLGPE